MPNEVDLAVCHVKSQILLSKSRQADKRGAVQHPYQFILTYLVLFLRACVSKFHCVVFTLSRTELEMLSEI